MCSYSLYSLFLLCFAIQSPSFANESPGSTPEKPLSLYEQVKQDQEGVKNFAIRCLENSCYYVHPDADIIDGNNRDRTKPYHTDIQINQLKPVNVSEVHTSSDGSTLYTSYIQDGVSYASAPKNARPYLRVQFESKSGATFPGGRMYPSPNVKVSDVVALNGDKSLNRSFTHKDMGTQLSSYFDYKIVEPMAIDPRENERVDLEISGIKDNKALTRVVDRSSSHK